MKRVNEKGDIPDAWSGEKQRMKEMFEKMSSNGVELILDGRSVLPVEVVAKTVCEDSPYMADYVIGECGYIQQIRFDKVKCR